MGGYGFRGGRRLGRGAAGRLLVVGAGAVLVTGAAAGCGSSDDGSAAASGDEVLVEDDGGAVEVEDSGADVSDAQSLLAAARAGDTAVSCAFEDEDGVSGTVYVTGETMRADMTTPEGEQRMLVTEDATYVWSEDEPGGMMLEGNLMEIGQQISENLPFDAEIFDFYEDDDADDTADVDCVEYTGGGDVFDVPSDRDFMSMGDMIGAGMGGA